MKEVEEVQKTKEEERGQQRYQMAPHEEYQKEAKSPEVHLLREKRMEGDMVRGMEIWRSGAMRQLSGINQKEVVQRTILWAAAFGIGKYPGEDTDRTGRGSTT